MSIIYANGFDTSKWQSSKVNYKKAKECGMDFVFLRVGCSKTKDPNFEKDYVAAVNAGLNVGAYYFTYSLTEAEATADATRVLGWLNNRHLDYPVVFDVEHKKHQKTSRKNDNSNMYNAFAAKIQSFGRYNTMLYTNENIAKNYFNLAKIKDPLWIAQYTRKPEIGRKVSIWQYSSNPINTSYFKGKLDVNYLLVDTLYPSNDSLELISLNPFKVPDRIIKRTFPMQKGDDVKWVQWELAQKKYLNENCIDGKWGDQSDAALKLYQKQHGLLVDGKCGSATRYCMLND